MQTAEVESMKVSSFPKLGLLELLVINGLIGEWHDAEISLGGEEASTRLNTRAVTADHHIVHLPSAVKVDTIIYVNL